MKNKLMKVSLLLFLMALIAGKSLSQNQPVRIKAEHPRLILSGTDIELMRGNALSDIEPWKTAWKKLKGEIDGYADKKWKPNVYRGDASMSFYKAAIRDGSAARDLAIGYQITKDKRYAHKAIEIINEWSSPKNAPGTYFDPDKFYPNTGMLVSRGVFAFLYAYDLLCADNLIEKSKQIQFEAWLRILLPHIEEGVKRWVENDYFGKQYFQNHIVAEAVGLMSIGIILRDNELVNYVYDGETNPHNIKKVIEGIILMKGQPPYCGEPGSWPTQDGEIMDRYRHFALTHYGQTTKPNRALQYAGLSTNLLMIAAEMGRLNGLDLHHYVAPTGESIKLPLLFYADFYITKDASIKGGFYTGEDSWINYNDQSVFTLWEVGHARYPEEKVFNEVLRTNDRTAHNLHLLGPVVLTHGRCIE